MFHFSDRSYGYNPKVDNPSRTNNITQMRSAGFQAPFFFGGSQVPNDLGIKRAGMKRPPVVDWRSNPVLPAGQNAATAWASSRSSFRRKK